MYTKDFLDSQHILLTTKLPLTAKRKWDTTYSCQLIHFNDIINSALQFDKYQENVLILAKSLEVYYTVFW